MYLQSFAINSQFFDVKRDCNVNFLVFWTSAAAELKTSAPPWRRSINRAFRLPVIDLRGQMNLPSVFKKHLFYNMEPVHLSAHRERFTVNLNREKVTKWSQLCPFGFFCGQSDGAVVFLSCHPSFSGGDGGGRGVFVAHRCTICSLFTIIGVHRWRGSAVYFRRHLYLNYLPVEHRLSVTDMFTLSPCLMF